MPRVQLARAVSEAIGARHLMNAKSFPAPSRPLSPAEQLADLLSRVHDQETGLVKFIAEVALSADEAPIHLAIAECQNPFLLPPLNDAIQGREAPEVSLMGTGAGLDRVSALWSTVGEAIERYALLLYDPAQVIRCKAADLDADHVTPSKFIAFADEQYDRPGFKFSRFDPDQELGWAPAVRLPDQTPAYLPAALSYMGYQHPGPEEQFDSGYSTGGAAGPTLEAAWHSGLLEVIERDSFACHWYLRRSPAEIFYDDYRTELPAKLVELLDEATLRLRFFDITTDLGVPTVLAVGLPKNGGVAIGAAARPNFAAAIEKAAIEAFHTHNWILDLQRAGITLDPERGIREYRDHVIHHLDPAHRSHIDFISAANGKRMPAKEWSLAEDPHARLAELCAHIQKRGYAAYGIKLTPEELDGIDMHVGRAFVPGLHPLGSGSGNEHLDRRRLAKFAEAAGFPMPDRLNLEPHPFP